MRRLIEGHGDVGGSGGGVDCALFCGQLDYPEERYLGCVLLLRCVGSLMRFWGT